MTAFFEPEIEDAAREIYGMVADGHNHVSLHGWFIADAIATLLTRYFPDLANANALDPQATVEKLLELHAAIHEDLANETPAPPSPATPGF
jgi:hypothetical protein